MNLRWGVNRSQYSESPRMLHAIDADKRDGNPMALCGEIVGIEHSPPCLFGESREGKCKKCFKKSRELLQRMKRQSRR